MDMEKLDKLHTELLEQWDGSVSTWSDFFNEIEKKMKAFQGCGCQTHAMDALYSMYAFILTMRDHPEEGDIKALLTNMVKMMVFDGKEKLGVTFEPMTDKSFERSTNASALLGEVVREGLLTSLMGPANSAAPLEVAPEPSSDDEEKGTNVLAFKSDKLDKKLH